MKSGSQSLSPGRRALLASAIAGVVVAAIVLMTPNLAFERFIVATGLPDAVAAAAPPLGVKARIVFALFAAFAVALPAAAILFVVVSRTGHGSVHRSDYDEFFSQIPVPRRRADSHPDAPPRPPINAGEDLGTPLDLVEVAPPPDAVEAADPAAEFETGTLKDSVSEETATDEPAVADEPDTVIPSVPAPRLTEEESFSIPAVAPPQDYAQREPSEFAIETPDIEQHQIADRPPQDNAKAELATLIKRFERGLERRRHAAWPANDAAAATEDIAPYPANRAGEDAELQGQLRDALNALQRLNARRA